MVKMSNQVGSKSKLKQRSFLLTPAIFLIGCGSGTARQEGSGNSQDNGTSITLDEFTTTIKEGIISNIPDTIGIEETVHENFYEAFTEFEPRVPMAQSYLILEYDDNPLTQFEPITYLEQDQLNLPIIEQSYAESYLSVSKKITHYASWSGNETLDALLLGSDIYPSKTDQVWTGIGNENVISFSFVDRDQSLLDEAAYGYVYSGGDQPINVVYNNEIGNFTDIQKDAIRTAFSEYEKYLDIKFVEVVEENSTVGTIRVGLSLTELDDIVAFALQPGSYWSSSGDIWLFKDAANDNLTPGESWYYYAFLHELGHALGLKHPHEAMRSNELILSAELDAVNYTLMSYNEPEWGWYYHRHEAIWTISNGPQVLDILSLQYIYGANEDFNSENTVYEFSPGLAASFTIWDGGGIDIFDFSLMEIGLNVSLKPGSYSTVPVRHWHPTDNIGIAYETIIENAIGSKADDTIIGNDYDNFISGHTGNDILYGEAGNDTFDWHENSRSGADIFVGGAGSDTYYVTFDDQVVEEYSNGFDTIILLDNHDFVIPDNVEQVIIDHNQGTLVIGNALDNVFFGGSGADVFTGGLGADIFLIQANMGHDIFTDFDEEQGDRILFAEIPLASSYNKTAAGFILDFGVEGSLTVNYADWIA